MKHDRETMRPRLLGSVVLLFLAVSVLCPASTLRDRRTLDGVAAHVNEHVITVGDVLAALQAVIVQLRDTYRGNELREKLQTAYGDALEALVARRLILDAYEKQKKMRIPDWVVDNRVEEIVHSRFEGDRSALIAALSKEQIDYEEWREEIREHIVVSSMRGLMVERELRVSPALVRQTYEKNLDTYRRPRQVRVRMIVLKKEGEPEAVAAKRELAARLRRDLLAGRDFSGLAVAHSEGIHASKGGDWGWIEPAKTLRKELADAVNALKTGEIGDVIETPDELYILRVEGRKDASVAPFAEVQPKIERELRRKEGERLYGEWIERLRKQAYVKVFDIDPF